MGLSNAERQRRYRARAAQALRNAQSGAPAGMPMTIPAALAAIYADPDPDPDAMEGDVVEEVARAVHNAFKAMQILDAAVETPAEAAIVACFGGAAYVEAVLAWGRIANSRGSRRSMLNPRNRPSAPAVPVT